MATAEERAKRYGLDTTALEAQKEKAQRTKDKPETTFAKEATDTESILRMGLGALLGVATGSAEIGAVVAGQQLIRDAQDTKIQNKILEQEKEAAEQSVIDAQATLGNQINERMAKEYEASVNDPDYLMKRYQAGMSLEDLAAVYGADPLSFEPLKVIQSQETEKARKVALQALQTEALTATDPEHKAMLRNHIATLQNMKIQLTPDQIANLSSAVDMNGMISALFPENAYTPESIKKARIAAANGASYDEIITIPQPIPNEAVISVERQEKLEGYWADYLTEKRKPGKENLKFQEYMSEQGTTDQSFTDLNYTGPGSRIYSNQMFEKEVQRVSDRYREERINAMPGTPAYKYFTETDPATIEEAIQREALFSMTTASDLFNNYQFREGAKNEERVMLGLQADIPDQQVQDHANARLTEVARENILKRGGTPTHVAIQAEKASMIANGEHVRFAEEVAGDPYNPPEGVTPLSEMKPKPAKEEGKAKKPAAKTYRTEADGETPLGGEPGYFGPDNDGNMPGDPEYAVVPDQMGRMPNDPEYHDSRPPSMIAAIRFLKKISRVDPDAPARGYNPGAK